MKCDLINQVAIEEIINPAFELTKQYFKVYPIVGARREFQERYVQ